MKITVLTLGIFMLAGGYGCADSSAPNSPSPTVVVPNIGTSWTFQNTYRDSTGKVTTIDTSTRAVVATNRTIQGFSDVAMTVETVTSSKRSDTIYIRYLSSGDISRLSWPLIGPHLAPEWLTIPYYTHQEVDYHLGGNVSFLGYTDDSILFTSAYADQENDTVAGVVYSASVINSTTSQHLTGPSKDSLNISNSTNSFIASAGIFGSRQTTLQTINGKRVPRVQQVLIAVNLK